MTPDILGPVQAPAWVLALGSVGLMAVRATLWLKNGHDKHTPNFAEFRTVTDPISNNIAALASAISQLAMTQAQLGERLSHLPDAAETAEMHRETRHELRNAMQVAFTEFAATLHSIQLDLARNAGRRNREGSGE